jgi:hypothetical protein
VERRRLRLRVVIAELKPPDRALPYGEVEDEAERRLVTLARFAASRHWSCQSARTMSAPPRPSNTLRARRHERGQAGQGSPRSRGSCVAAPRPLLFFHARYPAALRPRGVLGRSCPSTRRGGRLQRRRGLARHRSRRPRPLVLHLRAAPLLRVQLRWRVPPTAEHGEAVARAVGELQPLLVPARWTFVRRIRVSPTAARARGARSDVRGGYGDVAGRDHRVRGGEFP